MTRLVSLSKRSLVNPSSRPLPMARPLAATGNGLFELDAVGFGLFFGQSHPGYLWIGIGD